jgi:hypothetical protein
MAVFSSDGGMLDLFLHRLAEKRCRLVGAASAKRETEPEQKLFQRLFSLITFPAFILAGLDFRFGWTRQRFAEVPWTVVLAAQIAETPPRISELTAGLAPNQSHSAPVQASAEARIAASTSSVERVAVRPSRMMTIRGSCLFIAALVSTAHRVVGRVLKGYRPHLGVIAAGLMSSAAF